MYLKVKNMLQADYRMIFMEFSFSDPACCLFMATLLDNQETHFLMFKIPNLMNLLPNKIHAEWLVGLEV